MRREIIVVFLSLMLFIPAIPYVSASNNTLASFSVSSEGTYFVQGPLDEAVLIHTMQGTGMISALASHSDITSDLGMMALWYQNGEVPVWPMAYLFTSITVDYEPMFPGGWAFFMYAGASISLDAKINAIQSFAESTYGFRFQVMESYSISGVAYIAMRIPSDANVTPFINSLIDVEGSVYSCLNKTLLNNASYKEIAYLYSPTGASFYSMFNIESTRVETPTGYSINLSNLFETQTFKINATSYYFNGIVPYANITSYTGIGTLNNWPFAFIGINANTGNILNLTNEIVSYNYDLKFPSLMVYSTLDDYLINNGDSGKVIVHVKNIGNAPAYNLDFVSRLPTELGDVITTNNSISKLDVGETVNYTISFTAGTSVNDLVVIDPAYILYDTRSSGGITLVSMSQTLVLGVGVTDVAVLNAYITTPAGFVNQGDNILYSFHFSNHGNVTDSISLDLSYAMEWIGTLSYPNNVEYNITLNPGETQTLNVSIKATTPFVWIWGGITEVPAFFDLSMGVDGFTLNGYPVFVKVDPSFGYGLPEFKIERIISGDTVTVKVTNTGNGTAYALYVYDLIPMNATVVSGNYTGTYTDAHSQQKFVYGFVSILTPGESFSFTYTLSYTSGFLLSSNSIISGSDTGITKTRYTYRDQPIEVYHEPETTTTSSTSTNSTTGASETNSTSGSGESTGLPEIDSSMLIYMGIGLAVLVIIIAFAKRR